MTVCNLFLTPVVVILHLIVQIVRNVVETVCNMVTTTIKTVKEVAEKICKWAPWPLSKLCEWGTKLIEVVQTVTEKVCNDVLKPIIDFFELIIEYVIFIGHWFCWIVDWIFFRWLALLACELGIEITRCIPVCLIILSDGKGKQTISVDSARKMVEASNALLTQCDVNLIIGDVSIVAMPDLIDNVPTAAGQFFNRAFGWFSKNVCDCCSGVTIYFISSLDSGARGHAIPGSSYILVAVDAVVDDATIVHEIGHLSDLWSHDDEVGNVMSLFNGTPRTIIRKHQCCMISSSRFAHACSGRDG